MLVVRTSKVEGIKRGPTTGAAPSELLANIELDAPAVRRPVSSLLALGLQSVELASLLLTLHSPVLPCLSPQTGPPGILDFFGGQIFC